MDKSAVDQLIERRYPDLPPALQRAARHVVDNPKSVALQSMRAVAAEAGLPSSAMHRLARQLGFEGYESLRSAYRDWLARDTHASFTARATALQHDGARGRTEDLVHALVRADTDNLARTVSAETLEAIRVARNLLADARHIYVAGLRSLFPAAFYFNYACGMFLRNTTLLAGVGGIFADELRRADAGDALVIFSYEPYARDAVSAVRFAHRRGMHVIAVTDSLVSPVANDAAATIVVDNTTPSLFPSVVPALAIAQALVALLVASGGKASLAEIEQSEAQLREFAVYLAPRG